MNTQSILVDLGSAENLWVVHLGSNDWAAQAQTFGICQPASERVRKLAMYSS
jgi:hypothetical protein